MSQAGRTRYFARSAIRGRSARRGEEKNIDGHIQCLDLQADYSVVDGAVNLATAATHGQGFQLWHTWSDLSSITKGIGMASVAAFMGLAFANYKMYQLSQDALKDLRKNLNAGSGK